MTADVASAEITRLLNEAGGGDQRASDALFPMVYERFRALAGSYLEREAPGHPLQPTELVHEAYLKLVDQTRVDWKGRSHFFAVGAQAMRRILVDHARRRRRTKHGGDVLHVSLDDETPITVRRDDDVLAMDQALTRLSTLDARQARVVELRFFGGLKPSGVADALGVSLRTVERDWIVARAWLRRELGRLTAEVDPD